MSNGTRHRHRAHAPAIEYYDGGKEWWDHGEAIQVPYSYVLTAAFTRGLPIPEGVLPDMLQARLGADGSQDPELKQLNIIVHKYWPTYMKKILATLFRHEDPTIKHLAFSLLGRKAMPSSAQGAQDGVRL